MYCPKCNAEIPDGSIVCNVCDEPFAVEQQRGKFLKARENSIGIISDMFHSKLFLVLSIFMSVLCGVSFISTFSNGFDITSALVFAFSLVSMIAAWQLYSEKGRPDQKKMKHFKMLAQSLKIICKVLYITLIVVLVLCILLLSFSAAIIKAAEDEMDVSFEEMIDEAITESGIEVDDETMEIVKDLITGSLVLLIPIVVVVFGIIIALYVLYTSTFKKAERYMSDLEDTCTSGDYKTEKCPSQFIFVMGIICASIGVCTLSSGISCLYYGMIGAYLIVLSLVFKKLHALELENNKLIAAEEAELSRIAFMTNEYNNKKQSATAEPETSSEPETSPEPKTSSEPETPAEPETPTDNDAQ